MSIVILMITCAVLAALASWWAMLWFAREYTRYRLAFEHDTVRNLADFFLFLDGRQLWAANLAISAVPMLGLFVMGTHPVVAIAVGISLLLLPRIILKWARERRRRRLDAQLPDFLLALAGALRAGSGLQVGLRQVVQLSRRPLAQEFGLVLQQQRMGLSFTEALDSLQQRVGTESVSLVVAAIKVSGQTGGGLAETLETISSTVRERLQLLGKIRALTSQGRMQAWIMAGLPIVLIGALNSLDPATMSGLWRTPLGWLVILLIIMLEAVGMYLVRRIVRIEV